MRESGFSVLPGFAKSENPDPFGGCDEFSPAQFWPDSGRMKIGCVSQGVQQGCWTLDLEVSSRLRSEGLVSSWWCYEKEMESSILMRANVSLGWPWKDRACPQSLFVSLFLFCYGKKAFSSTMYILLLWWPVSFQIRAMDPANLVLKPLKSTDERIFSPLSCFSHIFITVKIPGQHKDQEKSIAAHVSQLTKNFSSENREHWIPSAIMV